MIEATGLGAMGTGTKFFRCGLEHSSGTVYLGTYGPAPAIVWKYDPISRQLSKIGEPGEYQLDSMVEAPDGKIFIGTAYSAYVYELDPARDSIRNLGTPALESTPWIFAMVRTGKGEIYGAKGVGLFRLDWENGKMEAMGIVPGEHKTGPKSSSPIVRMLVEDGEGNIWGDTNRRLFRFNPRTGEVANLVDMLAIDPACYGLYLAHGRNPMPDLYFSVISRFAGAKINAPLYVYRVATGVVEPVAIEGLDGGVSSASISPPFWWSDSGRPRLLVSRNEGSGPVVLVIDPVAQKVVDRWETDAENELYVTFLPGAGLYAMSFGRGRLLKADPVARKLTTQAVNPSPVECRCLAISTKRVLGADSYDCGYAFTFNLETQEKKDHGRVWVDDHRSNYGPAAFAGEGSRYFICNHSEATQGLWVTDTETNRHWRIGEPAVQLVAMKDGSVWGTTGRNPARYEFSAPDCWTPAWQAEPGILFRYRPETKAVDRFEGLGRVGVLVETPDRSLLAAQGRDLLVLDGESGGKPGKIGLKAEVVAGATDNGRTVVYLALADGSLQCCRTDGTGNLRINEVAREFRGTDRGFFVLPKSKLVVGVAGSGKVMVYDPASGVVMSFAAKPPVPSGPAIDPGEDAWYYAGDSVTKYVLNFVSRKEE